MLLLFLDKIRTALAEKPAIKIRGTNGKITKIIVPPDTTPGQMRESVRRHAKAIHDNEFGVRIINRLHSSTVVLDDLNYVNIWYGNKDNERA